MIFFNFYDVGICKYVVYFCWKNWWFGVVVILISGKVFCNMFINILVVVLEIKDVFIFDELLIRGDININYILVGGGILIVLFLCVFSL